MCKKAGVDIFPSISVWQRIQKSQDIKRQMEPQINLNQTSFHGAGAINEIAAEVKIRGLKKLGVEILLAGLHAKGTGHVCFTTACCTGNKKIPVFRYIFAGGKSVNEILVKFAPRSVIRPFRFAII